MSINASLVKGAVGLVSLSALSGGAGALYASTVTTESKSPELTIEEAIKNNRNKLKEILDALEKELGDGFKWNEEYWDVLIERMKKLVPEELQLRVVDHLWMSLPQLRRSPEGVFLLMEGRWKVGDLNFQRFVEKVRSVILELHPPVDLFSKEKFEEFLQSRDSSRGFDNLTNGQMTSLLNEIYIKEKRVFNLLRKKYSTLYGVNIPPWSDRIWNVVVSGLFFRDLDIYSLGIGYANLYFLNSNIWSNVDNIDIGSGVGRCLLDWKDSCTQELKKHFGSTSEVGMKSDSSVPAWSSMNSSLTLEQAISKNRDKLEKIFNALEKKLGEGFKWEKNKEYWDVLVEKMKEVVPEELRLYVVDHLWLLLPRVTSFGPLEKLVWFLMNETWEIEDSNFQSFLEEIKDKVSQSSDVSPISKDDFKERLKVSESFSKLPSDKKISLINDKYLRVKEVFEFYKKELWGEGSLSWSDNVWNYVVLLLFFGRFPEGHLFDYYVRSLLLLQDDLTFARLNEVLPKL